MAVIASSGYSEDPVISNPLVYGFSDSLSKPYMHSELLNVLNRNIMAEEY